MCVIVGGGGGGGGGRRESGVRNLPPRTPTSIPALMQFLSTMNQFLCPFSDPTLEVLSVHEPVPHIILLSCSELCS